MHIIYISTYPPRECGIATFCQDMVKAIREQPGKIESTVIALNDPGATYNYPKEVKFQIEQQDFETYRAAADFINQSRADLVNLQHEYGIYGGPKGNYVVPFLKLIEKPKVVTLHTVLPKPPARERNIIQGIAENSNLIVVMSERGREILAGEYEIAQQKIRVIPHGVPEVPLTDGRAAKRALGLGKRLVLSTFGLISPGKGIEYAIYALPEVVKQHPEVIYLVVGETHPQVRKQEGEKYRNTLMRLVRSLGLHRHVKFHNRYLTLEELIRYLQATDVYVVPYLNPDQIVSGTLSYALGCGKACVATPSLYAREILADGRGFLVGFRDPWSLADRINEILDDSRLKKKLERNAYRYSRKMTWKNVGASYLKLFEEVLKGPEILLELPPLKWDHLRTLTDPVGILQFSKFSVPDRRGGYTLDDNARALVVALKGYQLWGKAEFLDLIKTYLSFIYFAQKEDGKFHNFLSYDRKFIDREGSEDSYGRALWACGLAVSTDIPANIKRMAKEIFDRAAKHALSLDSPRGKAWTILGLGFYHNEFTESLDIIEKIEHLADSLFKSYQAVRAPDWRWFEPYLTYENARLPQALFRSYQILNRTELLEVAQESFEFLTEQVFMEGKFVPIGHKNWYERGAKRALYDQQPVEACGMVETCFEAYQTTGETKYLDKAAIVFSWFLGNNLKNLPLYDPETGACYDGLTTKGVNLNQGAESLISYLLARLILEECQRARLPKEPLKPSDKN